MLCVKLPVEIQGTDKRISCINFSCGLLACENVFHTGREGHASEVLCCKDGDETSVRGSARSVCGFAVFCPGKAFYEKQRPLRMMVVRRLPLTYERF